MGLAPGHLLWRHQGAGLRPGRRIRLEGRRRGLRKEDDGAVEIPIEGTLDLHTFKPSDVKDLVPEYLRECAAKGIFRVRVVHGKATGALARTVHSVLGKMPEVA